MLSLSSGQDPQQAAASPSVLSSFTLRSRSHRGKEHPHPLPAKSTPLKLIVATSLFIPNGRMMKAGTEEGKKSHHSFGIRSAFPYAHHMWLHSFIHSSLGSSADIQLRGFFCSPPHPQIPSHDDDPAHYRPVYVLG